MYRFIIAIIISIGFLAALPAQQIHRYEYAQLKMGTTFRVIFHASDDTLADRIITKCWSRLEELDHTFSDYREDSEASILSRSSGTGQWINVSEDMWKVLMFSNRLSILSKGAFDVTVGPLSKLWRHSIRRGTFPDKEILNEKKKSVGYQYIQYSNSGELSVRLIKKGMHLDFGGIAKGYAIDELYKILKEEGVIYCLIDGGGDIYAGPCPPDRDGWEVVISSSMEKIWIQERAIASSGSESQYLDHRGKRYSHIVDPWSTLGIENKKNVNVMASDCMTADGLASTFSLIDQQLTNEILKTFLDVVIK